MHAAGLHSALAIKRQRKRRDEQRRAKERRYSLQSSESGLTSPHASHGSLDRTGSRRHVRRRRTNGESMLDSKVVSSIGMLHIGVVFLVLGIFLVGSGLLPDDVTSWSSFGSIGWWNELVCTGLFAIVIGIFLIVLNKYISKREEEDLEDYVQSQLTRSRSGHRLERDAETGGMITKHTKREKRQQKEDAERGFGMDAEVFESPPHSPRSPDVHTGPTHHGFINPVAINGDPAHHQLDQIAEEEFSATSERGDDEARRLEFFNKETYSSHAKSINMNPDSPTRDIMCNGRHMVMSRM